MNSITLCYFVASVSFKVKIVHELNMSGTSSRYELDSLDLAILEEMLTNGRIGFKEMAEITKSDQRTIASRFKRMMKLGIVKRVTIEVDWSRIGFTATAYMGSTTALGEDDRKKLFDFLRGEPRILEADTTIGSHEYFFKAVDLDIAILRAEICTPLEPLTADLTTSIVTNSIKRADYAGLFRYLRNRVLK